MTELYYLDKVYPVASLPDALTKDIDALLAKGCHNVNTSMNFTPYGVEVYYPLILQNYDPRKAPLALADIILGAAAPPMPNFFPSECYKMDEEEIKHIYMEEAKKAGIKRLKSIDIDVTKQGIYVRVNG